MQEKDHECHHLARALDSKAVDSQLKSQSTTLELLLKSMADAAKAQDTQERRRCMQALYFDAVAQKDRKPARVQGTCEWFLQNKDFLAWREGTSSPLLWVSADPGCGKSVLSKTLVDEQLLGTDPATATVCYFFFKDNQEENRNATTSLASLLHQVLLQNSGAMDHAMRVFNTAGEKMADSFHSMASLLKDITTDTRTGEIVLLLDAFDECNAEGRKLWTRVLEPLLGVQSNTLKVIITS